MRGFALFLDPCTGEILAAAVAPHMQAGEARNWNFTDTYEPGSTYKMVTAGAALEEGIAKPDDVIEASDTGVALVAPGALFHDTHKEARYSFRDAVRWSSNIVMGKLGVRLGPERLYRYSTNPGFGSLTGVEFPGEAAGKLRTPDRWSLRSAPTIAIGHELTVTPLQLTLAYAAVANGGVLMHPMLVRETRDAQGHVLRRYQPQAAHRVLTDRTTALLREMLQAVVDSGTAKAARVPGLAIAGKTGTAQKYDAAVKTYGKGMFLSSFVGFVPAGDPHLVGVVVIDEPRRHHWRRSRGTVFAGRSRISAGCPTDRSTPAFRRSRFVRRSGARAGARSSPAAAAHRPARARRSRPGVALRRRGSARARPGSARGSAVERGARIRLLLSAPRDSTSKNIAEPRRPVRSRSAPTATLSGVATRIVGQGVVVRQEPVAGTVLPLRTRCILHCQPGITVAAIGPAPDGTEALGATSLGAGARP